MTLKTCEGGFQDLLRMSAGFCRLPTVRCKSINQAKDGSLCWSNAEGLSLAELGGKIGFCSPSSCLSTFPTFVTKCPRLGTS